MKRLAVILLAVASSACSADSELKLVATKGNAPAFSKVIWEIDSVAVSTSHVKTVTLKQGDYRVCANSTCRNISVRDGTKNTLKIEVE